MRRYLALIAVVVPFLGVSAAADDVAEKQWMWDNYYEMQKVIQQLQMQLIEAQIATDAIILDGIQQQNLRGMKKPRRNKPMTSEQCLTDNIYYEAASEPFEGKLAVAQVTMNRVADNFGGETVCDVVYFKKINPYTGKKEAAFSWTLGSHWRAHFLSRNIYRQCREIAHQVLTGQLHSEIIGPGVEYYHADYIKARWAFNRDPVAHIGHHIFYE